MNEMSFINKIAAKLKNAAKNYFDIYGILGIIAIVLVVLKDVVFYKLMGTASNFAAVCLVTLILTFLLFRAFGNKWIPAVIYALFSCLMFSDVTYASFFGRYLSVGMLGAAEVVGDIGDSIMEVLRPVNFLMVLDAAFIFFVIGFRKKEKVKPEESMTRSEKNISKKKHKKLRIACIIAFVLIIAIIALNVTGSDFFTSLSNQEFWTFHFKDAAVGFSEKPATENLSAWTDSYETEKEGPLFGSCEGKNIIMVQVESLQNFVIGREYNGIEITPYLNALIANNSTYFDNFYQQIGSGNTSDAEFAVNNSLYGTLTSYTYKLFNENYFRGLPVLLKERGYTTSVFHAHEDMTFWSRNLMYPSEGFDNFFGGLVGRDGVYNMTDWMGWGLVDSEFFPQAVELMKDVEEPFYNFVITLSNHHPYEMLDKFKYIDLLPEDENTIVGKYIQSAAYTDLSIGILLQKLGEAGLLDNSILVIYGDHAGLTHSEEIDASMEKLLGKTYDFEEMLHVPCIIYSPDGNVDLHQTISTAGGQVDILPTLAYLLGFDRLDTIYVGHNLYTVKEGLVAEQTFMTRGSFFTNDVAYEMSRDGVFENGRAWNIHTGEEVDLEICRENYEKSMAVINTSEYVLKSDAIRTIFLEGGSRDDANSVDVSRIAPTEIAYAGYPDAELVGTNSEEALDYSLYAGYRNLRLEVQWDENSEPYTVNAVTGEVEMTFDDIVSWMEKNASAYVYFDVDRSADYLKKIMNKKSSAAGERTIVEVPSISEYTGTYEFMLDAEGLNDDGTGVSPDDLNAFVQNNRVWAVVMSKNDADGKYAGLLGTDTNVYVRDEKLGILRKAN